MAHQKQDESRLTLPPRLPRKALRHVSVSNAEAAALARDVSRLARKFARLDAKRPRYSEFWTLTYQEQLRKAGQLRYALKSPRTVYECELLGWSKSVIPSEAQMAKAQWDQLKGLSPGFVFLQAIFEAALFRRALTRLAFAWVTNNAWHNAHCEHAEIGIAYSLAGWRLHLLTESLIWRALPQSDADRLLIARAHQVREFGDRTFELKYRRAVRKWQRERGEHLPERQIPRPAYFKHQKASRDGV